MLDRGLLMGDPFSFEKVVSSNDKLYIDRVRKKCVIYGEGFSVYIYWSQAISNSLESSALYLSLYEGSVDIHGGSSFPIERPKKLKEIEFQFDLSSSRSPIWRKAKETKRAYTTMELTKEALTILLNKALESEKRKK